MEVTVVRSLLSCGLMIIAVLAAACSGGGLKDPERADGGARSPTVGPDLSGTQIAKEVDARAAALARGAMLLDDPVPDRLTYWWETNFAVHSVPYSEIVSGGPPRDGIPPIDSPVFFVARDAPQYMEAAEPVIAI